MTGLVIVLLILAVVVGVVGLMVEALQWLLIIAAVLLVLGVARAVAGRIQHGSATRTR